MDPSSEASLYGHMNWSWHRLSNSLPWACLSFPPVRGGKARQKIGSHFSVQERPVLESSGAFLAKRPHMESST